MRSARWCDQPSSMSSPARSTACTSSCARSASRAPPSALAWPTSSIIFSDAPGSTGELCPHEGKSAAYKAPRHRQALKWSPTGIELPRSAPPRASKAYSSGVLRTVQLLDQQRQHPPGGRLVRQIVCGCRAHRFRGPVRLSDVPNEDTACAASPVARSSRRAGLVPPGHGKRTQCSSLPSCTGRPDTITHESRKSRRNDVEVKQHPFATESERPAPNGAPDAYDAHEWFGCGQVIASYTPLLALRPGQAFLARVRPPSRERQMTNRVGPVAWCPVRETRSAFFGVSSSRRSASIAKRRCAAVLPVFKARYFLGPSS